MRIFCVENNYAGLLTNQKFNYKIVQNIAKWTIFQCLHF